MKKSCGIKKKSFGWFSKLWQKLNRLYIAIILIIIMGAGLLVASCWFTNIDVKNISVGLGTALLPLHWLHFTLNL
jgi:hypothetical protein